MWRRLAVRARLTLKAPQCRRYHQHPRHVIKIDQATFYQTYPANTDTDTNTDSDSTNPPLFAKLDFHLPERTGPDGNPQYWAVCSPSSLARTTFLQVLAAQHICIPPAARTYPLLAEQSQSPQHAIKYVGFDADRGSSVSGTSVRGAYLSARYESRREETDFTVQDYLTGHTELNALHHEPSAVEKSRLEDVLDRLKLRNLLQMPVANLSNGQTRRARIAKALVSLPEVLLLDGPFMGLDPNTARYMAAVLKDLAEQQSPRLIISLRPEDGVPEWITHLVVANSDLEVTAHGAKSELLASDLHLEGFLKQGMAKGPDTRRRRLNITKDGFREKSPPLPRGEPLVEMLGVKVQYGDKTILGDWTQTGPDGSEKSGLWWSLHRGQRCGIFGPNGSGKTTMLSLITSDHPQTYSLPIKLFGRSRLPAPGEPGISLFDLQQRMGHSSPEVHAFFPKHLTVRRTIESAWADAPLAKPRLTADVDRRVDAILRWFTRELHPSHEGDTLLETLQKILSKPAPRDPEAPLNAFAEYTSDDSDLIWAEHVTFRDLSFSSQRLALFLRAIVASPDLVILDEALSGVDERVREKALLYLSHGETMHLPDPPSSSSSSSSSSSEESSSYYASAVAAAAAAPQKCILSRLGKITFGGLTPEQALLVVSHSKEDVPGCVREWICLPEPGEDGNRRGPRMGILRGPLELNPSAWEGQIWRI